MAIMATRPDTPISQSSVDRSTMPITDDTMMPTTPPASVHPDSSFDDSSPRSLRSMERDFFVPGETILARSDEVENPLDIEDFRHLQTANSAWKSIKGFPPSVLPKRIVNDVYPRVWKLLNEYWKSEKVPVRELDTIKISGWSGSAQGARTWLRISMDDDIQLLKLIAEQIHKILTECELPEVGCIIMLDNYSQKTFDDEVSQSDEKEVQKATQQAVAPDIAL